MAIKVNFFCTYTFFFVPLHREPALGMSAHQRRRVADIIKSVYWRLFWSNEKKYEKIIEYCHLRNGVVIRRL